MVVDKTLPKSKKNFSNQYNKIKEYLLIKELSYDRRNVSFMCKQLEISRSPYYK